MRKVLISVTFLHTTLGLRLPRSHNLQELASSEINTDLPSESSVQHTNIDGELSVEEFTSSEISSGFPSRTLVQLAQVDVKFPTENTCAADVELKILWTGFGSKITNLMNQIGLAIYGRFSVTLGHKSFFMDQWKSLFKQTLPICNTTFIQQKKTPTLPHYQATMGTHFFRSLAKVDQKFVVNFKRAIYSKFYQLNDETNARITQHLQNVGLFSETKYIGVHLRRGDKYKEAKPVPYDIYGSEIKENAKQLVRASANLYSHYIEVSKRVKLAIEEQSDLKTIYLATDDAQAKKAMLSILGEGYKILGAQAKTWNGNTNSYASDDYMLNVLADVEALRRSHVFIGTASSNFGRLVYFLRHPKKKSISLDRSGDWLHKV